MSKTRLARSIKALDLPAVKGLLEADPELRDVRDERGPNALHLLCAQRRITYQCFSLLTANPEVLAHPLIERIAARGQATPAQVVFRFARAVGMLPLTGTSSADHMRQDLASGRLPLSAEEIKAIESLAG